MFDFLEYIKNPIWIAQNNSQKLKDKLLAVAKILIFTYFILLITSLAIYLFDYLIVQKLLNFPSFLKKSIPTLNNFKNKFPDYYFILLVFVGPLFEELVFRLPLDFTANSISICLSILLYRLFATHFFSFNIHKVTDYLNLSSALILFLALRKIIPERILKNIKNKNYSYIFYSSAALFGLAHVTNFGSLNHIYSLLYIVYILPQFIMGISIGYIRIKYGFIFGLLVHIMINLIYFFHH